MVFFGQNLEFDILICIFRINQSWRIKFLMVLSSFHFFFFWLRELAHSLNNSIQCAFTCVWMSTRSGEYILSYKTTINMAITESKISSWISSGDLNCRHLSPQATRSTIWANLFWALLDPLQTTYVCMNLGFSGFGVIFYCLHWL